MRLLDRRKGMVGIVAAGLLATACGAPAGSSEASPPQGSQEASPEPSVVSADLTWEFWIGGTEDQEAWEYVADQVTADHPGITVTLQGSPWPDYWSRIGTQLASPAAPCIVGMQSLRMSAYADALLPLDDLMAEHGVEAADFDQSILDGLKFEGAQVALPYDFGPMILYYNRDAFAAAGVPEPTPGWTLDDFQTAATALTTGDQFGFATASADLTYLAWVQTLTGAPVVDDDGNLALTSPEFVEGYTQYVDLMRGGIATPEPGASGAGWTTMINQFTSGQAAMMVEGPWSVISVKDQSSFSLGVAPMPAGPDGSSTYTAGSGFGISRSCANPEAAFLAIASMTSDGPLESLAAAGRAYPARPAVQEAWYGAADLEGSRETLEYASTNSVPLVTPTNWVEVGDLLDRYGVQALSGEITPEEALQTVQEQAGAGS